MSVDLTELMDVAARAHWASEFASRETKYEELSPNTLVTIKGRLLPTVQAVAKVVEAQVRAEIAAQMDAESTDKPLMDESGSDLGWFLAMERAEKIARGGE